MPPRAGLDREVVVRAAAELYDASGGRDVTLKDVATRLGVKTPSLYNHIAGQGDLIRALAVHGVRKLEGVISRAAIGKSGDAAVMATAHAFRRFAHEHPGLYSLTLHAPAPDDEAHQSAARDILQVLHLVFLEYGLSEQDEVHAIRGLRSLVHGFVSLELSGGFGMPVDIDESYDILLKRFVGSMPNVGSLSRSSPQEETAGSKEIIRRAGGLQ